MYFYVFGFIDGLCVGVYPSQFSSSGSAGVDTARRDLLRDYNTTLSSLTSQSTLVVIVLLSSQLFSKRQSKSESAFSPMSLFDRQTLEGIDRTHILYNHLTRLVIISPETNMRRDLSCPPSPTTTITYLYITSSDEAK